MKTAISGKTGFDALNSKARSFLRDRRGNIAIMTAFLLPAVVLGAGVAVDYSSLYLAKSELQQMADASVMAAAREMVLINKTSASTASVAKNFIAAHMATGKSKFGKITEISVAPDTKNNFLTVSLTATKKNAFGGFLQPKYTILTATAKAKVLAGVNICAIGLSKTYEGTIKIKNNSMIVGNGCAIYSNSKHSEGIELQDNANMKAGLICSAGGVKMSKRAIFTKPVTDCPPIEDPLASRPPLPASLTGGCDHTDFSKDNYVGLIWPGTYCGGLEVKGMSVVNFMPGIYVIKDGDLEIEDYTVANGNYVGFYFNDLDSRLTFAEDTTISMVAPRNGAMAGMLFLQNTAANSAEAPVFEIHSNNARTLLGTIYLPKGKLSVKSKNPVADDSAFTVIITIKMKFEDNARLVLNSDYSATDVPVPDGIVGQNAKVYLTK